MKSLKEFCKEFGFDGRKAETKERYQIYLETGEVKKGRGRPKTGKALTAAERKAKSRAKAKEEQELKTFVKEFQDQHGKEDSQFMSGIVTVLGAEKALKYLKANIQAFGLSGLVDDGIYAQHHLHSTGDAFAIEDFICLYEKGNNSLDLIFKAVEKYGQR